MTEDRRGNKCADEWLGLTLSENARCAQELEDELGRSIVVRAQILAQKYTKPFANRKG